MEDFYFHEIHVWFVNNALPKFTNQEGHVNHTFVWYIRSKKWKTKINTDKYSQVIFTLKKSTQKCPQLIVNNIQIKIKYIDIGNIGPGVPTPYLKNKNKISDH